MLVQKAMKRGKHRKNYTVERIKKTYYQTLDYIKLRWKGFSFLAFIVFLVSFLGPWNEISLASEEKTPRGHIEIATYSKERRTISVKFCHDGGPEIWFGDKYPDFNLFVDGIEKSSQLVIKEVIYPTKSLKSNECANVTIKLINLIEESVKINVRCNYNGSAWFAKCSLNPIDSKEVLLLGSDIILVDATGRNDKIELDELKLSLENNGAKVLVTQAPGKGKDRDGMYKRGPGRAVIFSDSDAATNILVNTKIKEGISQLSLDTLSLNLDNLAQPKGETDYALMLDSIGDCRISTDERGNICDFEKADFDILLNSHNTHLFTKYLVSSMNNPIVIIIPTTEEALKN